MHLIPIYLCVVNSSDVNECTTGFPKCEFGRCQNIDGGYFCECNEGYEPSPSGQRCLGKMVVKIFKSCKNTEFGMVFNFVMTSDSQN